MLNVAAVCVAIWIAGRCGGRRLVLGVAAFLGVATAWYGASVLTQPWNPYLPLVSFMVALLAAWAVLEGHTIMLVPLVVAASLCAQTHVPYLTLGVALCAVGFLSVARHWWRARSAPRRERWIVGGSVLLGLVLWLPPLIDQARHTRATSPRCAGTSSTRRSRRPGSSPASRSCSPTSTCGTWSCA